MMKKIGCLVYLCLSLGAGFAFAEDDTPVAPAEVTPAAPAAPAAKKEEDATAKPEEQPQNVKIKPMYDNNRNKAAGTPVEYQPRKAKTKVQEAIVATDGAAMYKRPNFDSPVIGYLNARQKVTATQKMFHGEGGFGAFYKISANKKIGFIADTDLVLQVNKSGSPEKKKATKQPKERHHEEPEEKDPIYFTRYFGATLGYLNFSEKYAGSTYSSQELMYGLKFTGPDVLFDSAPPLDITVAFHSGAPELYKSLGAKGATGYFIFTDMLLLLPLNEWGNYLINYGIGAMFTYTSFKVPINGTVVDSSDKRFGLALDLGGAYRFGNYAARLDVKYYYEKTSYLGYWAGIQMHY